MGAALLLTCAVIDEARTPDWDAAIGHIAILGEDDLAEWREHLDEEGPADDGDDGRLDMDRARRLLHADLQAFRDGVDGDRTDLDWLAVRGARVWVTGGMSYGDEASDLAAPMKRLHAAGVLAAAGFDDTLAHDARGDSASALQAAARDVVTMWDRGFYLPGRRTRPLMDRLRRASED